MGLKLNAAQGGGSVELNVPEIVNSDVELTLPSGVGTAGQVLQNSATPGTLEFGGPFSRFVLTNQSMVGQASMNVAVANTANRVVVTTANSSVGGANGAHSLRVRVGGADVTAGYTWNMMYFSTSANTVVQSTTDFKAVGTAVVNIENTRWVLEHSGGNIWTCHLTGSIDSAGTIYSVSGSGSVSLNGPLDGISMSSTGGAFDAGRLNVIAEG